MLVIRIKADFVFIASSGWFETLSESLQLELSRESQQNGSQFFYKDRPITCSWWNHLSVEERGSILSEMDDETSPTDSTVIEGYDYLKQFHNQFPDKHGANCFARVVYALTENSHFIHHWIFEDTLLFYLKEFGYNPINDSHPSQDDVVCFFDAIGMVHSFYCLDSQYCFNKYGQSMHEP